MMDREEQNRETWNVAGDEGKDNVQNMEGMSGGQNSLKNEKVEIKNMKEVSGTDEAAASDGSQKIYDKNGTVLGQNSQQHQGDSRTFGSDIDNGSSPEGVSASVRYGYEVSGDVSGHTDDQTETTADATAHSAAGSSETRTTPIEKDGTAEVDYSIAAGTKENIRTSSAWSTAKDSSYYAGRNEGVNQSRSEAGTGYNAGNGTYENSRMNGNQPGSGMGYNVGNGTYQSDRVNMSQPGGAGYAAGNGTYGNGGTNGNQPGVGAGYAAPTGSYVNGAEGDNAKNVKKKRHFSGGKKAKKTIAAVVAVLLCFGAGFGGGALASHIWGDSESGTAAQASNISIDSSESGMDAASVIAKKTMPSVVGISTVSQTYTPSFFGMQSGTEESSGTGFIVDGDGYILTNAHVVEGSSSSITVDLYDGSDYSGTVLWSDSTLDLAIVKIEAKNLQTIELGDSDSVEIGDYAVAIGNPLGSDFERSVTQGIISGLDRTITTSDANGQNYNTMQGLIQTDASINAGNSGGPLINSNGQVIGINTAKASSAEGLGFAIPINTALPIIEEIKENGTYETASLGITGINAAEVIASYETDFKTETGIYVAQILTDSAAAKGGMKEGDIITALEGVTVEDMNDLRKELIKYRPGDKVTITVERDKAEVTLDLTLQAQDDTNNLTMKPDIQN